MGGDDLGEESFLVDEITPADFNEDEPKPKRRKREKTSEEIIIETGRKLQDLGPSGQAFFLNTAMKHYVLKEESYGKLNPDTPLKDMGAQKEIIQEQFLISTVKQDAGLKEAIRSVVSFKKLKHWKGKSPCVVSRLSSCDFSNAKGQLVVCSSARRAVAILKDIADFHVRVAKIFPKAGSIDEQREKIKAPIAVGTPHRLRQLSASWEATLLVILDGATSNKQFTVCTSPDTAHDCMAFLKDSIAPELAKRKTCRLAIF